MKAFELGQESYWDCTVENPYLSYTDEWEQFVNGRAYAEDEARARRFANQAMWMLNVEL